MAKSVRTKKQAQFEKKALRKLKSTGIYTGKVDLRKRPTKAQKRLIAQFQDVVSGKATVLKPKNPKAFKSIFRVKNGAVIVPRRKGEKVALKGGEIVTVRKVGRRKVKSVFKPLAPGEKPRRRKKVQYAIPFLRGGELAWQRFPDWELLAKQMETYKYKNWPDYVVEEELDEELSDEELTERLDDQLSRKGIIQKRRRT